MGSNDEKAYDDEKPAHTVYIEAFYIDKYPVTNNQYKTFIDANPQWHKHQYPKRIPQWGLPKALEGQQLSKW